MIIFSTIPNRSVVEWTVEITKAMLASDSPKSTEGTIDFIQRVYEKLSEISTTAN